MLKYIDPAKYLISLGSNDIPGVDIDGLKRVRKFKVAAGTTLEHFKRRDTLEEGQVKKELALFELEDEVNMDKMKDILKERTQDEVGWYKLKQVY